ncbi:MAG: metalloregulator ArsR/SmtB family transcription factor [Myxococcota bacterium]
MIRRPDPELFSALADPTRLDLVERLLSVPSLSTTQLTKGTGLTRQAIHKHLTVLEGVGLVAQERVGRRRLWSLDARPLGLVRDWSNRLRAVWAARFDQLERLLAEGGPDDPRSVDP